MRTNMMMLAAVLCSSAAYGDTFFVDSSADSVDAVPGDGVCATGGGVCTLRAAIMEANALAGDDRIDVPAGVFMLSLAGDGEDAAATGDLDITDDLRIVGAGRDDTVINGIGADRVFHIFGASVDLFDLTLRGGVRPGDDGGGVRDNGPGSLTLTRVRLTDNSAKHGGGLNKMAGHLILEDCLLDENAASHNGGGVYLVGAGDLEATRTTFDHNTCVDDGAGLLYGGTGDATLGGCSFVSNDSADNVGGAGLSMAGGTAKVVDCSFESNTAVNSVGGLYVAGANVFVLRQSRFASNLAATGGVGGVGASSIATVDVDDVEVADNSGDEKGAGAFFDGCSNGSLTRCTVSGNHLAGLGVINRGGGLYLNSGNWTTTDCTFDGNTASDGVGGGLMMEGVGGLTLVRCTISNNVSTAPMGAAGGLGYAATLPGVAINCTFSGNTASVGGGGVGTISDLTFTNCTFADNEALGGVGGAIFGFGVGTIELENTILAASALGANCGGVALFVSNGNNIDADGSCALAGPADQGGVDPLIGPLQNNGGPTRTHALLVGSPAIDAGADVFCPGEDQRGVFRPFDGVGNGTATCDIGAFELTDCNGNGQDDALDVLDATSTDCNTNVVPDDCEIDTDADGVIDDCDNCIDTSNPGQEDTDGNSVGDACEAGVGAIAPSGGCGTGLCATGAIPFMPLMLIGLRLSRRRISRRRRWERGP